MSADSDGGAVGTIEPLAVISSMATRSLLADIARVYADRAGVELRIESVGGVDAAKRIRAGEKVDVVVLASGAMTTLAADGFVAANSLVDVARSPMAAAVPAGRPRPSLGTGDAVKRAMLDASSIGYSTGRAATC